MPRKKKNIFFCTNEISTTKKNNDKKMSKNKSSWKRNKLPRKIKLGLDNLRGSYREFRKALIKIKKTI